MLSKIIIFFVLVFSVFGWLSPFHMNPWLTVTSEICVYISLFLLILNYRNNDVLVPKISILMLIIPLIPVIQYFSGIILFFETALLCFAYLACANLSFIYGYNYYQKYNDSVIYILMSVLCISTCITIIFALTQFFGLEKNIWFISPLNAAGRIFANFAQPNNMATFLVIGLLSSFWLFQNNKIHGLTIGLIGFFLIFVLYYSYSRVGYVELILSMVFLFIYSLKGNRKNIKYIILFLLLFFIFTYLDRSIINLVNSFDLGFVVKESFLERVSNFGGRYTMWPQMIMAIKESSFFGYGWNQTAIAQIEGAKFLYHSEQTRSAHNIILDLIIWNGIFLGSIIVGFLTYLFFKIIFLSTGSIFLKLMIICFSIHALLEFPQNYACFLFLVFFIMGVLWCNVSKNESYKMNYNLNAIFLFIYLFVFGAILHDYLNFKYILVNYDRVEYKANNVKEKIFFLDRIDALLDWVFVDKKKGMSNDELNLFKKFVISAPTEYNLINMTKILIINNKLDESKQFYKILQNLYHTNISYEEIFNSVSNK